MLTPDEKLINILEQKKEIEKCTKKYIDKFIYNKFRNLNFHSADVEFGKNNKYVMFYLENEKYFFGKKIILSVSNGMYSSRLQMYMHSYDIIGTDVELSPVELIIERSKCKQEYEPTIRYFSNIENIKNSIEYVFWVHNLVYRTTYIYCLPLAYTFLLCNYTTKKFPRDIAKLITYKILFFGGRKKMKKEKEYVDAR